MHVLCVEMRTVKQGMFLLCEFGRGRADLVATVVVFIPIDRRRDITLLECNADGRSPLVCLQPQYSTTMWFSALSR